MAIDELWVLGPGESINLYPEKIKKLQDKTTLVFQNVFPNCFSMFSLVPDYWTCFDPNSLLGGLEFLDSLEESESQKFKKMNIIIPHFISGTYNKFRRYCGTTPLGRKPGEWEKYIFLLEKIKEKGYNVDVINGTTTKHIKKFEETSNNTFKQHDIYDKDAYLRFMYHEPIFGTVEYDHEGVHGSKFKWGLENKLSSAVLPICFYLKAKNVFIAGFDFKGGRFYDISKNRHPWNDETQKQEIQEYPLSLIQKWSEWEQFHDMNLVSVIDEDSSLLSKVLKYEDKLNEL